MDVSALLVLVLSGIRRHVEEAATKASEDEIKFDEVHAYLSKGEYSPCVTKSQKLVIRRRAKDYQLVDGQVHYVGDTKWICEQQRGASTHTDPLLAGASL